MISPDEAKKLILENTSPLESKTASLEDSLGHCLSVAVQAPHDHPFFDHSAMDGYAIRFADVGKYDRLRVIGEIPAGKTEFPNIGPGNAVRIFTGAAIPPTADTVVIQERVERNGQWMSMTTPPKQAGENIRRRGEQIEKGSSALSKGTLLDSAAIGFLASIGVQNVDVYQNPSAAILTTGNEFIQPGKTPEPGQIFESNGAMLRALLNHRGLTCEHQQVGDNPEKITEEIKVMADNHDILFITGGVSVGDYDFTPQALVAAGFKTVFHKINQKPGKPLLFAVRNDCVAFGLPGNPRSVLACFLQYAVPCLDRLGGSGSPGLVSLKMPLSQPVKNPSGKTLFLFAEFAPDGIQPRSAQGSHMLQSCVNAPAMIEILPDQSELSKGDEVQVYLLPR